MFNMLNASSEKIENLRSYYFDLRQKKALILAGFFFGQKLFGSVQLSSGPEDSNNSFKYGLLGIGDVGSLKIMVAGAKIDLRSEVEKFRVDAAYFKTRPNDQFKSMMICKQPVYIYIY